MTMAKPPGTRLPAVVQAALVMAEPYEWMVRRQRRYGDVSGSCFPLFGDVVYVASPAGVKAVFGASAETHHAGAPMPARSGPCSAPTRC